MRRKNLLFVMLLSLMLVLVGCGNNNKPDAEAPPAKTVELNVFAAASLTDAAQELQKLYNKEHPDIKIVYNFASSGTLQKQIEEGAPADLFISAGKKQMDTLQEAGLIVDSTRQNLLGNELVLIVPQDSSVSSFKDLATDKIGKIGIGTPETVPVGKYSQEALTTMGIWESLQPKLVMAKDVRQVLTYVESNNVDAGLVYRSDTYGVDKVRIVETAPAESHSPIVYPMAIVKASQQQAAAEDFFTFLTGGAADKIFEKYGFIRIK